MKVLIKISFFITLLFVSATGGLIANSTSEHQGCEITSLSYDDNCCQEHHSDSNTCENDCEQNCFCCVTIYYSLNPANEVFPSGIFSYVEHNTNLDIVDYPQIIYDFLKPPVG